MYSTARTARDAESLTRAGDVFLLDAVRDNSYTVSAFMSALSCYHRAGMSPVEIGKRISDTFGTKRLEELRGLYREMVADTLTKESFPPDVRALFLSTIGDIDEALRKVPTSDGIVRIPPVMLLPNAGISLERRVAVKT
jgi:hypothetical protein